MLPPPAERFDPITARWLTPGGPLHDPLRDEHDPEHREPLTLVGPIPSELTALEEAEVGESHAYGRSWWRRRRWLLLTLVALGLAAMLISGSLAA
jgi:ferric-dicitrate binding protein FerR (iron transport regulator)